MTDGAEEVRVANERFYQAFEQLDVDAMAAAWSHGEHVKCIHPGWPLLCGWPAVRASWQDIFAGTAEMRFTIGDAVLKPFYETYGRHSVYMQVVRK